MIDVAYIFSFWLFTWYSSKLLYYKNSLADGYWHIPQTLFLIAVYLLPVVWIHNLSIVLFTAAYGLIFPFFFNTGLNIYRKLPIQHLGKYDWLSFPVTLVLFIAGIILRILL